MLSGLDDEHQAFFRQQFLGASWYDALPLLPLSHAGARARSLPHYEATRDRARLQARDDAEGVYRALLKRPSPELAALRIGRVLPYYFDFGRGYSQITHPGTCEVVQSGMPSPLVEWAKPAAEGFLVTVIAMAGGKNVRFTPQPPTQEGQVAG